VFGSVKLRWRSGVERSGDARGDCFIGWPLPNSSIHQWRMVVIVTRFTMFVTSQYDIIFTFVNQRFGEVCWQNVHIQGRRSSGREAVRRYGGPFVSWAPPMKAPRIPNWIMKHYKSVEFYQISECQPPLNRRRAPYWKFSRDGSAGKGKQWNSWGQWKHIKKSLPIMFASIHQQCWPQK